MQEFLKADIFFFVATIALVLVTIGFVVALVYIIRILKDMKILSRKAKDEGEKILEDVKSFREDVEYQSASVARVLASFIGFRKKKDKGSRKNDTEV